MLKPESETAEPRDHLIRKGIYYYRPNRAGYTGDTRAAGRYTKSEAEREAAIEPERMEAVPLSSLPADPRIDLVRDHFMEWHGASPDDREVMALLERIDGQYA